MTCAERIDFIRHKNTVFAACNVFVFYMRSLVREDIYRAKLRFSFFYVQCITDVRSLVREDI